MSGARGRVPGHKDRSKDRSGPYVCVCVPRRGGPRKGPGQGTRRLCAGVYVYVSAGAEAPGRARARGPAGSVPVYVRMCPPEGRPRRGSVGPPAGSVRSPPALCRCVCVWGRACGMVESVELIRSWDGWGDSEGEIFNCAVCVCSHAAEKTRTRTVRARGMLAEKYWFFVQ